jgi:hypothetical protein
MGLLKTNFINFLTFIIMAKELANKSVNSENDIAIYKSRTPKVNDVIIICGQVKPVVFTSNDGKEWLNAIPVLVNGRPSVLPLSSWGQACFDGNDCFPQNRHETTRLINDATSWEELRGLANTPFEVVMHYNFTLKYKKREGTYNWTSLGCEWIEGGDHTFSAEEIAALTALVAEAQAKLSK